MNYEEDDSVNDVAYRVSGCGAIAWRVLGWETVPDDDTEWTGIEQRTGKLVAHMVGDDVHFRFDPAELVKLNREDYCGECGQIGCTHDRLDREGESP
jgi:hypothetical protein